MTDNKEFKQDCPDCDYKSGTEEFSSDFIVETENDKVNEFVELPNEFASDNTAEFSNDSYDEVAPHNFENARENVYADEYCKRCGIYDSEHADEIEDNYDVESADDYDSEAMQYVVDPSDETAATVDEWYTTGDTPAQEHCKLDDYEIISDVLGSEKEIVKLCSTALCETAEEPLRDIIRENFDEAAADQFKAFTFMQERGMYQTEQASEEKITEAKQQFCPICSTNCGCNNSKK